MEVKLRKLWPLVGALCATVFSSAFAQSNYSSGSSSNSSSYGSGVDSSSTSAQSGQGTYQRGTFREITPNAGPRVAHGADVFITADFIWWKAVQDGLDYGITGFDPSGATVADPFADAQKGKISSVGQDWAPGFKVGLGLNLGHDGWDLYTQYTWLHASDNSSLSRDNGVAFASFVPGNDGPTILGDSISSNWDLHFNVIDLELGRNFYLSQFLTMRPFIGFKGTWQDQDWKSTIRATDFEIDVDGGNSFSVTGPFVTSSHTDTWGVGVRGGFNVAWYMSKSWSFYGDFAWTAMWTDYDKLTRKDRLDDASTGNSKLFFNLDNDSFYTIKYVGEMELGLRWEMWFYDDNYHFAIQAGWEEQVWVNW
jgi:hypothetical protein